MKRHNRSQHRSRANRIGPGTAANRLVLLLLIAAASNAWADTLKVGSIFPTVDFLQMPATGEPALVSLPEVQEKKAIVFVFASW